MEKITLSILVITHNQEKEIERCLDSVLAQKLSVPYEIIISDDASTKEMVAILERYEKAYPDVIRVLHFNTNDYGATIGSERSGLNRINAYQAVRGEFFVYMDGDDYLTCDTVYQEQIDLLKQHQECSMCRQEMMRIDSEHPEKGTWKWGEDFETGRIISGREYIEKAYFLSNPAFMMRRYEDYPPKDAVFRKQCYDEFITFWYLQKGDIVCLNRADYMYVAYPKSIDSTYDEANDKLAKYNTSILLYMHYFPKFSISVYNSYETRLIHFLKDITSRDLILTETMKQYLNQFDGFIFRYLVLDKHSIYYRIKLWFIRLVALMMKRFGWTHEPMIHYVYRLLTSKQWDEQLKVEKQ